MLENNKNLMCESAEEIVSYLYDELSGVDKTRFEKHLEYCSACAEELSAFSLTRSAVQKWRHEKFIPLPTPIIEIPYDKKPVRVAKEPISRSWLVAVRDFFTLSPAWMTVATASAALIIFVGLFLVMFSSLPENDDVMVQQTKDKNIKVSPSPTGANKQNVSETKENGQQPDNSPKPLNLNNPSSEVSPPTKVSTGTKPANSNIKKPVQLKENNKPLKNQTKQTAPRLIDDEEEDDSLRLSDLLEGIGTDD